MNCLLKLLIFVKIQWSLSESPSDLDINVKEPISIVCNKFLSLTLDLPLVLENANRMTKNMKKMTNMGSALSPGYVRIGGSYNQYISQHTLYPTNNNDYESSSVHSEVHWALFNEWAKSAKLDVIVCIPSFPDENNLPTPVKRLMDFTNHMNYTVHWQLGCENSMMPEVSSNNIGNNILLLREKLNEYPLFSNSKIIGPDIISFKTNEQREYIQDYTNISGSALSAIVWRPEFTDVVQDENTLRISKDNLAQQKDTLYEDLGKSIGRIPLWIAESRQEAWENLYLGALIWARRLGTAAKLGIQVLMRQPSNLLRSTPDYWVSVLHKTLVGREVFDVEVENLNNDQNNVYFYSHCTRESTKYERGSLTVFGINLKPNDTITATIKGFKVNVLHEYILSPGPSKYHEMFSTSVFLNGKRLNVIDEQPFPSIEPRVLLSSEKNLELKLSHERIGFWVLPDAKVNACMGNENTKEKQLLVPLKKVVRKIVNSYKKMTDYDSAERDELYDEEIPEVVVGRDSTELEKTFNPSINPLEKFRHIIMWLKSMKESIFPMRKSFEYNQKNPYGNFRVHKFLEHSLRKRDEDKHKSSDEVNKTTLNCDKTIKKYNKNLKSKYRYVRDVTGLENQTEKKRSSSGIIDETRELRREREARRHHYEYDDDDAHSEWNRHRKSRKRNRCRCKPKHKSSQEEIYDDDSIEEEPKTRRH